MIHRKPEMLERLQLDLAVENRVPAWAAAIVISERETNAIGGTVIKGLLTHGKSRFNETMMSSGKAPPPYLSWTGFAGRIGRRYANWSAQIIHHRIRYP